MNGLHDTYPVPMQEIALVRTVLRFSGAFQRIFALHPSDGSFAEYQASDRNEITLSYAGNDFYTEIGSRYFGGTDSLPDYQRLRDLVLTAAHNGTAEEISGISLSDGQPVLYRISAAVCQAAEGEIILIGIQPVQEQADGAETESQQLVEQHIQVAEAFADAYDIVYSVEAETGRYIQISNQGRLKKLAQALGDLSQDFFEIIEKLTETLIYPDDRPIFRSSLRREVLLNNLQRYGFVSLTYRMLEKDTAVYFNLLALQNRKDTGHFTVAVRNVDAQTRYEQRKNRRTEIYSRIAMALASRYEVIYDVDLATERYHEYSASERYADLGIRGHGTNFFETAQMNIWNFIYPDDVQRVSAAMEKDQLMYQLSACGSFSLTYRQYLEGRPQYVTMLAVRPKDSPNHLIIAVLNVDEKIRQEQEMEEESHTFSQIIHALSSRYEVIYYVNTDTNKYTQYSSSEKYAQLQVGIQGNDFFGETQKNLKTDIYPEDYPMMRKAMEKTHFIERLSESGIYTLNYRLMLDGRPQYVTLIAVRPKDDEQHVIIAVANIDAATRKEMAITEALGSAMDIANRDALTGVKSKHAYTKAVLELEKQIAEPGTAEFAVVVADVNSLKQVNDSFGHSAGDDYLKQASLMIGSVFKHSPVFRIGGDEFAVLLIGMDFRIRDALMEELIETVNEHKRNNQVTVAAGIAVYDPETDRTYSDTFDRADLAMYRFKKQFKKRHVSSDE